MSPDIWLAASGESPVTIFHLTVGVGTVGAGATRTLQTQFLLPQPCRGFKDPNLCTTQFRNWLTLLPGPVSGNSGRDLHVLWSTGFLFYHLFIFMGVNDGACQGSAFKSHPMALLRSGGTFSVRRGEGARKLGHWVWPSSLSFRSQVSRGKQPFCGSACCTLPQCLDWNP